MLRGRGLLLGVAICGSLVIAAPTGTGARSASTARLVGTPHADDLKGTPKADVIRGLAGADVLDGGRGADQLYAGPGNDRIEARDPDTQAGGRKTRAPRCLHAAKPSRCLPVPGNADVVVAGPGNDIIRSRDGRADAILCGPGQDIVIADSTDLFSRSNPRSACETVRLRTAS